MRNTFRHACDRLFMLRFQYMGIEGHIIKWCIDNLIKIKIMSKRKNEYIERARNAINGQYVSKAYAQKHPKTTVIEKDKVK